MLSWIYWILFDHEIVRFLNLSCPCHETINVVFYYHRHHHLTLTHHMFGAQQCLDYQTQFYLINLSYNRVGDYQPARPHTHSCWLLVFILCSNWSRTWEYNHFKFIYGVTAILFWSLNTAPTNTVSDVLYTSPSTPIWISYDRDIPAAVPPPAPGNRVTLLSAILWSSDQIRFIIT